jgi:hypothetical protein
MKNPYSKIVVAVALCACVVFAIQSCTKLATLLNFDLSMQTESVNITIPVVTDTTGVFSVQPGTASFNVDSFIRASTNNQLGAANITSVKLSSVLLALNNATASSNFQNFESCYASFYSNTNTTPYSISITGNPDVYATTLSLPADTSTELETYIGNEFTYSIAGQLRRPTTIPLNCTVTFTFSVKVQG